MSERMPERMSDRMPERMSDRMPDRMSDRMPDRLQVECQVECQNICQIDCQIECQKECQIECQIECHNICQKECLDSNRYEGIIFLNIHETDILFLTSRHAPRFSRAEVPRLSIDRGKLRYSDYFEHGGLTGKSDRSTHSPRMQFQRQILSRIAASCIHARKLNSCRSKLITRNSVEGKQCLLIITRAHICCSLNSSRFLL